MQANFSMESPGVLPSFASRLAVDTNLRPRIWNRLTRRQVMRLHSSAAILCNLAPPLHEYTHMPPPPADELRFTHLWMQAQPAVASALIGLVGDRHAVDDLLQEVSLAAYRSLANYDPERDFTGWALGIARHKAIDHLRRQGRECPFDPAAVDQLCSTAALLAGELDHRAHALHRCISTLSDRAKDVLRRHHIDGQSIEDMSKTMGLGASNVKVTLHRAREALRSCIERQLRMTDAP